MNLTMFRSLRAQSKDKYRNTKTFRLKLKLYHISIPSLQSNTCYTTKYYFSTARKSSSTNFPKFSIIINPKLPYTPYLHRHPASPLNNHQIPKQSAKACPEITHRQTLRLPDNSRVRPI